MCTQVYLGADRPLRVIPYNLTRPGFYVELVPAPATGTVNDIFPWPCLRKPFVYYVGSHSGCAWGLEYFEPPVGMETEWDLDCLESTQRLSDYLVDATRDGPVELLVCWLGREDEQPAHQRTLTPDYFAGRQVVLQSLEGELITVRQNDDD